MIIYGWGTFRRRNLLYVRDACSSCGRTTYLRSCDASTYATLYFVPIFPVGARRVVHECPHCKKGLFFSRRKYRAARASAVEQTRDAYLSAPGNAEKARELLGAVQSLGDRALFLEVAPRLAEDFRGNAPMLAAIAGTHGFFLQDDEALALFRKALALAPDDAVVADYVRQLIHSGELDEAGRVLAGALPQKGDGVADLCRLLIEAYQADGRHADALRLVERLTQRCPGHEPAEVSRLRAISEKHAASERRIESPHVPSRRYMKSEPATWLSLAPALVLPLILIVIAIAVYRSTAGASPHVFLASGIDVPYEALINGVRYQLAPHQLAPVSIEPGAVTVDPVPGDIAFEPASTSFAPGFFGRDKHTFIINPDRCALFTRVKVVYSESPRDAGNDESLLATKPFYAFSDIDFPFTEPPQTMRIPSSKGVVTRWALKHYPDLPALKGAQVVAQLLGAVAGDRFACLVLQAVPGDPSAVQYLYALAGAEALPFLRSRLSRRPVLVEYHRAYQEIMERTEPDYDLVAEYRRLSEAEPENRVFDYLLGRVLADPREACAAFTRATLDPGPCSYGFYALARDEFTRGDFARALEHTERALSLEPEKQDFASFKLLLLLASGRPDELIAANARAIESDRTDRNAVHQQLILLEQASRTDEATRVMANYLDALAEAQFPPALQASEQHECEAARAQGRGDEAEYLMALAAANSPESLVFAALTYGDLEAADALMKQNPDLSSILVDLTFFLHAAIAVRDDLALRYRKILIEEYKARGRDGALVAEWFAGSASVDIERARRIPTNTGELATLLAALSYTTSGEDRAQLQSLARKLNFGREFPYFALRRILGGDATPAPAERQEK